jgi:hypothetical protein
MALTYRTGMAPQMAVALSRIGTLLTFTAGAVFSIACANVISFLLGRAFTRSHETSLRIAIGAGRRELVREVLADIVVISIAGGLCGMLLAICRGSARVDMGRGTPRKSTRLEIIPRRSVPLASQGRCHGYCMVYAGLA